MNTTLSKQEAIQAVGWRNEYEVLKYLLPVLKQNDKVGRIYYAASCYANQGYPNPFPKINVQPPTTGVIGLDAVTQIFNGAKNVLVAETPNGVTRIKIRKVSDAVLQTRISSISFDSIAQYNPSMAIDALGSSADVRVEMHRLGIHVASRVTNEGIVAPAEGLPHLPGSLKNVTMDQALDLVAKVFGGVVIYANCMNSHSFMIDFVERDGAISP